MLEEGACRNMSLRTNGTVLSSTSGNGSAMTAGGAAVLILALLVCVAALAIGVVFHRRKQRNKMLFGRHFIGGSGALVAVSNPVYVVPFALQDNGHTVSALVSTSSTVVVIQQAVHVTAIDFNANPIVYTIPLEDTGQSSSCEYAEVAGKLCDYITPDKRYKIPIDCGYGVWAAGDLLQSEREGAEIVGALSIVSAAIADDGCPPLLPPKARGQASSANVTAVIRPLGIRHDSVC